MRVDILTLFPEMFKSYLTASIIKHAQDKGLVRIKVHDIRQCASDRHKTCDDRPYGGGPGMLLKPDPIDRLARKILKGKKRKDYFFIYMTPQGKPFSQSDAVDLSKKKHLVILCGHYEGVDERIRDIWVDSEVSIGDYVLTGGELPAMVILDASTRLIRGVIGNEESKNFESFSQNLIEYPQYTRPQIFRGHSVPGELLTGNHKKIDEWRHKQSLKRTKKRRPDLYSKDAHCARPNQERDRK